MDRGLCPIPDLSRELTARDRNRIQFVLGVMKKDELSIYLEEADNIIIQIDPEVGPSENFAEFLDRWRRGPTIGSKPPSQTPAIHHLASSPTHLEEVPLLGNGLAPST